MAAHTIDYDALAAAYACDRQVHPGVLERLAGAAPAGAMVLEVGCGTGNYIIALAAATGADCWGIDPSEGMLDQARRRASPVRFRFGRAEQIDAPADSFDLLFTVDVIHHVDDRCAYLRQAHRVLKPGAKLCTVTDSAEVIRRRQPLSTYFAETIEPELARYPRIIDLESMMREAGFDQITQGTVEWAYELNDLQPYRDKAYSALHLISEAAFQTGLARMQRELQAGPLSCVSRYTLLWGMKQQP
jgi:ubiquinone/menaquinone biosynthesis C-methylase UbiE